MSLQSPALSADTSKHLNTHTHLSEELAFSIIAAQSVTSRYYVDILHAFFHYYLKKQRKTQALGISLVPNETLLLPTDPQSNWNVA